MSRLHIDTTASTVTAGLNALSLKKAGWLKVHCRQYGHDLGQAISVVWLADFTNPIEDFEDWKGKIVSKICDASRKDSDVGRKRAATSFAADINEQIAASSADYADPLTICLAFESASHRMEECDKHVVTAKQLAADHGKSVRWAQMKLKRLKEADDDGCQANLFDVEVTA